MKQHLFLQAIWFFFLGGAFSCGSKSPEPMTPPGLEKSQSVVVPKTKSPLLQVQKSTPIPTSLLGGEVRNGGYGVRLENGKLVSLDLLLRGVHNSPVLSSPTEHKLGRVQSNALKLVLSPVAAESTILLVEAKLAHFKTSLEMLGVPFSVDALVQGAQNYTFVSLDSAACLNVRDDASPVENKVQIAYREGRWIRFCKDFGRLEEVHKVALITHEIIYAGLSEKSWVTEMTGLLFSSDFVNRTDLGSRELQEVGLVLAAHAIPLNASLITRLVSSVPANIPRVGALNPLCWGAAYKMEDQNKTLVRVDGVAIWEAKSCEAGIQRATGTLFLETENTQILAVSKDKKVSIGSVAADGKPVSLCSDVYQELCQLQREAGSAESHAVELKLLSGGQSVEEAVASGNTKRLNYFKSEGWKPQNFNIADAISENRLALAALDWLLAEGTSPNQTETDVNPESALQVAILGAKEELAERLLLAGGDYTVYPIYLGVDSPCLGSVAARRGLHFTVMTIAHLPNLNLFSACISELFHEAASKGWQDVLDILVSRGVAFPRKYLPAGYIQSAGKYKDLRFKLTGAVPFCPQAIFEVGVVHLAMLSQRSSLNLKALKEQGLDFNTEASLDSGECFGIQKVTAFDLAITNAQSTDYGSDTKWQVAKTLVELGANVKAGSLPVAALAVLLSQIDSYGHFTVNSIWKTNEFSAQQIADLKKLFELMKDKIVYSEQNAIAEWLGVP